MDGRQRSTVRFAVVKPRRSGKVQGCVREDKPSRDSVDNSDPVVTAATASECDENDLVQRQRNSVGGDVVLDVVRYAPAEGLNREAE